MLGVKVMTILEAKTGWPHSKSHIRSLAAMLNLKINLVH